MLRIVNETGVANDTRITDDDGNDITRKMPIKAINIAIKSGEPTEATLETTLIRVSVQVGRVSWVLPWSGQIKTVNTITFDDGSSVDLTGSAPVWSDWLGFKTGDAS